MPFSDFNIRTSNFPWGSTPNPGLTRLRYAKKYFRYHAPDGPLVLISAVHFRVPQRRTMQPGTIVGIVGSVIGICGGIVGTYFSIRSTNGPKERSLVIKASAMTWVAVAVFLSALLLLPSPYNQLMWIPYGLLLGFGFRKLNEMQKRIHDEEITFPS